MGKGAEGPEACHNPVLGVAQPQAKLQRHEQGCSWQDMEQVIVTQQRDHRLLGMTTYGVKCQVQLHVCAVEGAKRAEACHEPVLGVAQPQANLQLQQQGCSCRTWSRPLILKMSARTVQNECIRWRLQKV
jgi:hypothetical protein